VVTVSVISRRPFIETGRVELEPRHLKRYPHFDSLLEISDALDLVNDPKAVQQHAFYPFIVVRKKHQPFRKPKDGKGVGSKPEPKERLLRSAARRDAAIYAAYRARLAPLYNQHLEKAGIGDSVIAYRSIPRSDDDRRGKSNIHHANEVFREVARRGDCVTVALDISSFFESIDHGRLKHLWAQILGTDSLPKDHNKVFKNITRYSQVEHEALYRALGLTRTIVRKGKSIEIPLRRSGKRYKKRSPAGSGQAGHAVTESQETVVPRQLCTPGVFREKVCGEAPGATSLLWTNRSGYGIPQGSPISDLLANISLFNFDQEMCALAAMHGGIYRRYSDDMLFVIDGGLPEGESVRDKVIARIQAHGPELRIKPSKTNVVAFTIEGARQRATCSDADERQVDGLEYLGFRYDGSRVFFRQSTISRLRRRIWQRVKREAIACARRYPQLSFAELEERFRTDEVLTAVGRVPRKDRFGEQRKDTFHGYARRATQIFGSPWGDSLLGQVPCHHWVVEARRRYFSTPENATRLARSRVSGRRSLKNGSGGGT